MKLNKLLFLFVGIFFFSLVSVSAIQWSNDTFNNSLTTEALVFSGDENITRYLSIPSGVSYVTNAFLNLSGYHHNLSLDEDLVAVYVGSWEFAFGSGTNENWNDYAIAVQGGQNYVFENYSNSFSSVVNWTFKFKQFNQGGSMYINISCYNYTSASFVDFFNKSSLTTTTYTKSVPLPIGCLTNDIIQIRSYYYYSAYDIYYYEGRLDGDSNLTNPYLEIGTPDGIHEWNYTGEFTQTNNRTSNLFLAINAYLSTSHLVPFLFHSDTAGILQYLDMLFSNEGFAENSQSYNTTSYETATESFVINVSYDNTEYTSASGTLNYNGTAYTGTKIGSGVGTLFTKSLTHAEVGAGSFNRTFYWLIGLTNSSGANYYNSTFYNQTVKNISLTLCGGAGGSVPFLNFTFKDEADASLLNASIDLADFDYWLGDGSVTKEYITTNSTDHLSYAFCFDPPDRTLDVDLTFKYSRSSYPIRTFQYDDQSLTNSTTNQVLYLLATADGIYSAIQTAKSSGAVISGVKIVAERQFSGIWTTVEQGLTGSDGLVTFWLNPSFDHRLTATKTGYASAQVTIRPSQSTYTLVMSKTTGEATYNGTLKGMSWKITPTIGRLNPSTTYIFGFNLTANLGNLDGSYCKMELINSDTDAVLNTTTGGNAYGCNLSATYTTPATDLKIKGKYYIDTSDTSGFVVIDADAYWVVMETDVSTWTTFKSFLEEMKDLPEFGEGLRQEYSRIVSFFFLLTVILGLLSYFTGYDLANPGSLTLILLPIIWLASLAGWFEFTNLTSYVFFQKYTILTITIFITGGWWLHYFSRNA